MERIAIIGLGLIGGSIGLALKQANLTGVQIAGTARSRDTVQRAKKRGAIDEFAHTPEEAVRGAKLVIVASPIMTIPSIFDEIARALEPGAVVTDVASTKGEVMRWAREKLPRSAHFVGGHPMAGKETSGIDAAEADLFRGRPWVIVPSVDAPEAAVTTVISLAHTAGATTLFMDADEHDSYVAAISHLPLTLASALFSLVFGSEAWPEMAGLASSGFRDTTRLASGAPEMAHDIVMTNRENVLHWLDRMQAELARFREAIASGESERVIEAFTRAQIERDNYMINGPPSRETGDEVETISLGDMLMGTRLKQFMKKQEDIIRAQEDRAKKR
ncbi:MAG: prephenate dehydrogenase/arogenate dehydrogenase family protein [Dehalococcoidia bacterium]